MGSDDEHGTLFEIMIFEDLYEIEVVLHLHHSDRMPLNAEIKEITSTDIYEYDSLSDC